MSLIQEKGSRRECLREVKMDAFDKIYHILDWIFDSLIVVISNIFLIIFTILVFTDVISRYLFGKSFSQISEYSIFLFIWMVFLMMGKVLKEKKHINIGILSDYLVNKRMWGIQCAFNLFLSVMTILFSIVFLYFSILDTKIYYVVGYHSTLDYVPFYWIWHLALPVGLVSLLFYSVRELIISARKIVKGGGNG